MLPFFGAGKALTRIRGELDNRRLRESIKIALVHKIWLPPSLALPRAASPPRPLRRYRAAARAAAFVLARHLQPRFVSCGMFSTRTSNQNGRPC